MIVIETEKAVILINEAEISDLHYKKEENEAIIHFRDYVGTAPNIKRIKTYPGTPDMTFVNNVKPEPEPEPKKIPISQVTVVEIGKLMDEMEEVEVLNRGKYQKGGLYIRFLNACRAYNVNIQTLEDLLKMGKADFRRLRNIGPQVITLLDKVLETKYGITKW
jgi:hypothetical protein